MGKPKGNESKKAAAEEATRAPPRMPVIGGHNDSSHMFGSLEELWADQRANRAHYYAANHDWWEDGGYGGANDDEAMIGDSGSDADIEHSIAFLRAVFERCPRVRRARAMDGGAGVGRVTKNVLLKAFESVHLLEGSHALSKHSRRYLGNKRAQRCTFAHAKMQDFAPMPGAFALIWLQWVLQYLIDEDVVAFLRACGASLERHGVLVVKENRPSWSGKASRFEFDTPLGPNARFDITRPDAHHAWLFAQAGLHVVHSEHFDETTSWLLVPQADAAREAATKAPAARR
jgi:protein N-terminal methyltransferase